MGQVILYYLLKFSLKVGQDYQVIEPFIIYERDYDVGVGGTVLPAHFLNL